MNITIQDFKTFIKALKISSEKHKFQTRKDEFGTPYINHPIDVVYRLSKCKITNNNFNTYIAAVIHDLVEDTPTTIEDIEHEFGKEVASIVAECTDDTSLPKHIQKQQQIETASSKSYEAKLIKLADKLSNISDAIINPRTDRTIEKRLKYAIHARTVVEALDINNSLSQQFQSTVAAVLSELHTKS